MGFVKLGFTRLRLPIPYLPGVFIATFSNKNLAKRTPLEVVLGIVILIAFWWIVALFVHNDLIIPTPAQVLVRLGELGVTPRFWLITGTSLLRILIGFFCGMITGVFLAVLMRKSIVARTIVTPVIHIIRATPVVSFIIIALIWLTSPALPSFIAFLMVLPVVWENMDAGLGHVDLKLLQMAQIYGLNTWRKVRYIYYDSLKPYVLAAATSCMGLAWKSGVTAEVIASPALAIGRQLDEAKVYLQTTDLFAWTITLIIISLLLELILKQIINRTGTHQ